MKHVLDIIIAILLAAAPISAQQVNLFGKVTDAKGAALDSVVVRLQKYPAIRDTTDKKGIFTLSGQASTIASGTVSGVRPLVHYVGANVYFAVDRPTRIAVETFTSAGRRLAKLLDEVVLPGGYMLPVAAGFAPQTVLVRVLFGSDVRIFRMRNSVLHRSQGEGNTLLHAPADMVSIQSTLLKTTGAIIDTLVFSRSGFITQTRPISSYAPADSITVSLTSNQGEPARIKAKVMAAADSIKLAVQSFRGKNFKRPVFVSVDTRSQYAAIVGGQTDTIPQTDKNLFNNILRIEGLLRASQDYYSTNDSTIADETAGFYVPGTDSLYVILADTATGLAFEDSLTIFHELVHALQDQYFNLTTIVDSNASSDTYFAGHHVIEGEAELLMEYYGFKLANGSYPTSATPIVNFLNQEQIDEEQQLDSLHQAGQPLIANMPSSWEYFSYGPKFINAIAGMTWSLIDTKIFKAFPLRMFEILHPERYSASNQYVLNVQNLESSLTNSNYYIEDADELGELLSDVMFREWNFPSYQNIPDGMMADNIIVYRTLQTDTLRMIWNTYWQDSSAAAAFFLQYASLVDKKKNIQLPAPVNSGKYSYISDTHNNIYIEQSKSYVFTLEKYQTSSLSTFTTQCRAIKPQSALAKVAAGEAAATYPHVGKHRLPGGKPHPFRITNAPLLR